MSGICPRCGQRVPSDPGAQTTPHQESQGRKECPGGTTQKG